MKINLFKRPLSLALRLTIFIGSAMTLLFLIFSYLLINSVKQHFIGQDTLRLQKAASAIEQICSNTFNQDSINGNHELLISKINEIIPQISGISFYLSDDKNQDIYSSALLNSSAVNTEIKQMITMNDVSPNKLNELKYSKILIQSNYPASPLEDAVQKTFRSAVIEFNVQKDQTVRRYSLVLAVEIDAHLQYLKVLQYKLWGATFIAVILVIIFALVSIAQGLAPLHKIIKKIQNISSTRLDVRLCPETMPIELSGLAHSFNAMIEKIEDVFQRQSNFSADIAHEIRTPITNLATQTQIILNHARTKEEYQEILYSNLEEYERMAKMVSDMLFLAQADDNLLIPENTQIDLSKEINIVLEYFEPWAEEISVGLALTGDTLIIQADSLMFRRALNNLLSNAIRYTPALETIVINVSGKNKSVEISIANPVKQGAEIPAEHLPKLFDRFYRVDKSRQSKGGGTGIGLSIVKSILSAHGGSITAQSQNQMTTFTLILPIT
ncbi:copper-sensing histidine kinase in two-component regulatory system with CusR [Gammaproteobacteria bacterium]|nr:copper-sensing histidine kinase in two-component regulatory system with CusR [Gammaproteobacteria bacterium]